MALNRQRKNLAYGLGVPLQELSPQPVVSNRAPTTSDKAALGTVWVYKATNAAYVLASIVANSATWTPLTVNAGATISTGNLTVTTGNIVVTAGDITATAGDITATAGDVVVSAGDIAATLGDITAVAGTVTAGATVVGGTGITATTGDVTCSAGDVEVTIGDVHLAAGDVVADLGNISATVGTITAGSTITGLQLYATGDDGTGVVSTVSITNITDDSISTGVGDIKMKSANPGTNTGWLKIYRGTVASYIPYWDTNTP